MKSYRAKKLKHLDIIKNSIDGVSKGYAHREHRSKAKRTGKKRIDNQKRNIILKIKNREWEMIEKCYNIILLEGIDK